MYLKKLVLDGFKSFYSRTEITFEKGIIGIVGPNGCGKSNIYDAVQWVLGEQSAKQLRGDEISDVISMGNVRRGAKNTAEAYVTFAECGDVLDTDRDEIEVGRKVDSDGQGTYFLNGEKVRLKDINDLFRDTGIGKDLYSSIGQGEVLTLIDSNPEERREIIEEAAGIASFRHRRDLTRRRLDQTRDELKTIQSELNEKQGRLSQLKGQAEKAKKVRSLQKKVRKHRAELSRRDFLRLEDSVQSLIEERSEAKNALHEQKEKKRTIDSKRNSVREELDSISREQMTLKEMKNPLQSKAQDLRDSLNRKQSRSDSLLEQIERDANSIDRLKNQFEKELGELVNTAKTRVNRALERKIKRIEHDFLRQQRKRNEQKIQSCTQKLDSLRDHSLFRLTETKDIKRKVDSCENDLESIRDEIQSIQRSLPEMKRSLRETRTEINQIRKQLVRIEAEKTQLEIALDTVNTRLKSAQSLHEEWDSAHRVLEKKIERKRESIRTLSQEVNDNSYQDVLDLIETENLHDSVEVLGALGEVIDVSEDYTEAVESALEPYLDAVIVRTTEGAKTLANTLGEHDSIGRVRILAVERLKDKRNTDLLDDLRTTSEITKAVDLVDFSHVDPELDALLSDVLVTSSISTALSVYENLDTAESFAIVTESGDRLESGGFMSVGIDSAGTENILTRRQKVKNLESELEQLESTRDSIENIIDGLENGLKKLDQSQTQINGALQGIRSELRNAQSEYRDREHKLTKYETSYNQQIDSLAIAINKKKRRQYALRAVRVIKRELDKTKKEQGQSLERCRTRLKELKTRRDRIQEKARSVDGDFRSAKSQATDALTQEQDQIDRCDYALESIDDTKSHQKSAVQNWLEIQQEISNESIQQEYVEYQMRSLNRLLTKFDHREDELRHDLDSIQEKLQNQEGVTEKKKGDLERIKSELSNEKARLQDHVEQMKDEFDMDPDSSEIEELQESSQIDIDRDELSSKIRSAQSEIRELQPVNMLAEEKMNELDDEVSEIAEQKDDLETSCNKLENIIRRMNKKAREQFMEAFEEIKEYFSQFIEELFQGGTGQLELTDDPVLEAGIKIEIEPPGEQLKTMSALSGGEKTLGALAFLFSLFERKSTPFCFLDEVDHPFDDENVSQFVNLLMRFKNETQFIVITHNKSTMQAADKLFGVTMEESGVTSVIPMKFDEAEALREPQEV